jgi:hypothetical protein
MQQLAGKFLMTMKDYPPSQAPGDWSLDSLEKQISQCPQRGTIAILRRDFRKRSLKGRRYFEPLERPSLPLTA